MKAFSTLLDDKRKYGDRIQFLVWEDLVKSPRQHFARLVHILKQDFDDLSVDLMKKNLEDVIKSVAPRVKEPKVSTPRLTLLETDFVTNVTRYLVSQLYP